MVKRCCWEKLTVIRWYWDSDCRWDWYWDCQRLKVIAIHSG